MAYWFLCAANSKRQLSLDTLGLTEHKTWLGKRCCHKAEEGTVVPLPEMQSRLKLTCCNPVESWFWAIQQTWVTKSPSIEPFTVFLFLCVSCTVGRWRGRAGRGWLCDSGHSQSAFLNTFLQLTWHEAKSLLIQLFFSVGHQCQLLTDKGGVPGPGVHTVAPTDCPESTQNLCHHLDETASWPKALFS